MLTRIASWFLIAIVAVVITLPSGAAGWGRGGLKRRPTGVRLRSAQDRSNMVPMRDGTLLSTDIYFPAARRARFRPS